MAKDTILIIAPIAGAGATILAGAAVLVAAVVDRTNGNS